MHTSIKSTKMKFIIILPAHLQTGQKFASNTAQPEVAGQLGGKYGQTPFQVVVIVADVVTGPLDEVEVSCVGGVSPAGVVLVSCVAFVDIVAFVVGVDVAFVVVVGFVVVVEVWPVDLVDSFVVTVVESFVVAIVVVDVTTGDVCRVVSLVVD